MSSSAGWYESGALEQPTLAMEFAEIPGTALARRARRARHLGDRRLELGRNRRSEIDRDHQGGARPRHQRHRHGAGLRLRPLRGDRRQGACRRPARDVLIATKVGLEWQDGKITRNAQPRRHHARDRGLARGSAPTASTSTRCIGPTRRCRSTRRPRRCASSTSRARSAPSASAISRWRRWSSFGGVSPLHVLQPPYNLFERGIEAEILPYCRKHRIATLGYGALCRGLLSGRMRGRHQVHRRRSPPEGLQNSAARASRNISPPSSGSTASRTSATASA